MKNKIPLLHQKINLVIIALEVYLQQAMKKLYSPLLAATLQSAPHT